MGKLKAEQLRPTAGMALIRLEKKKQQIKAHMNQQIKQVAALIQSNKIAQANISAEKIVKADWKWQAFEQLELHVQTVQENASLICSAKTCPLDMEDSITSILYATDRVGVEEFQNLSKMFKKKYGSEFVDTGKENRAGRVDRDLVHRLSGQRPNAFIVFAYLKEIASMHNINWEPDEVEKELGTKFDRPMALGGVGSAGVSGLGAGAYAITDGRQLPKGQVPAGYIPPVPKELSEDIGGENNNNNNDNDDNAGGDIPVAQPVEDEAASVPHHAVRKEQEKPQKKTAPAKPKQAEKPPTTSAPASGADNDLAALQARLAALRRLG